MLLLYSFLRPVCVEGLVNHVLYGLITYGREKRDEQQAADGRAPLEASRSIRLEELLAGMHLTVQHGSQP